MCSEPLPALVAPGRREAKVPTDRRTLLAATKKTIRSTRVFADGDLLSDLLFVWTDEEGAHHFSDAWTDDAGVTHPDEKHNFQVLSARKISRYVIFILGDLMQDRGLKGTNVL